MFGRPLNSTTPFSTDYRGLLVAKVTAKYEPTTGVLAGRKVYAWTEQVMTAAGGEEEPPQARRGVYESATVFDGVLLDANDADLTLDAYVWARMKGAVGGATVYETVTAAGVSGTGGGGGGCEPPGLDPEECVEFTVGAGAGRCVNIESATIAATLSGGWWVADDTITTAAGAGTIKYRIGSTGYPEAKITVGVTDYYGSPAGCDAGGRQLFKFGGSALCDGTADTETCDNGFTVAVACVPCNYDGARGWYCCTATSTVYHADNAEEAAAGCVTGTNTSADVTTACGATLKETMYVTVTGVSGTDAFDFTGAAAPMYYGDLGSGYGFGWSTNLPPGPPAPYCGYEDCFGCASLTVSLRCNAGSFQLIAPGGTVPITLAGTPLTGTATVSGFRWRCAPLLTNDGSITYLVTTEVTGERLGPFATEAEAIAACEGGGGGAEVCDAPACPDGASTDYSFTLAGGTSDFAGANGAWTLTYTTGDIWAGTLGDWTASLDASTGTLTLAGPADALLIYDGTFNCCAASSGYSLTSSSGTGTTPGAPTIAPDGACDGCP